MTTATVLETAAMNQVQTLAIMASSIVNTKSGILQEEDEMCSFLVAELTMGFVTAVMVVTSGLAQRVKISVCSICILIQRVHTYKASCSV